MENTHSAKIIYIEHHPSKKKHYLWQRERQKPKYEIKDGVGIIPEWATEIEKGAFEDCEDLREVVIPQGVRKIGKEAFYGCKNLEKVELPEWLEEIGEDAFWDCSSLTSIRVSENTKIAYDAFKDCPEVKIERY